MAQQVASEAERLRLRQIRQMHRDLDAEERERKRQAKAEKQREAEAVQQKELARARAAREAEAARQREAAEREAKRQRRQIVQDVKRQVISGWWRSGYQMPSDVEAEATLAVDTKLSALAVEELPRSEVISIAEGIRDGIYRREMDRQDQAKQREKAVREEQARQREEQQRAKEAAVKRGLRYAEGKLEETPGLDSWKRALWLVEVRRGLDGSLTGTETPEAIHEAVDEILRPKLKGLERDRREAEEQEAQRKKEEADRKREARKQQLSGHVEKYARDELAEMEDLEPGDRWTILAKVREALQAELDGSEDEEDVEDLVDEIIDREMA